MDRVPSFEAPTTGIEAPTALLFDTNVFLNVAIRGDGDAIVNGLVDALRANTLALVVPDVVVDEFKRRKSEATTGYYTRVSGHIQTFSTYRHYAADGIRFEAALGDIRSELARRLDQTPKVVETIENLITVAQKNVRQIVTPDAYYSEAAKRIRSGKAPGTEGATFARSLVNDQLLWMHVNALTVFQPVIFCSDNSHDFSDSGSHFDELMTVLAEELGDRRGRLDYHSLHGYLSAHYRNGAHEAHLPVLCVRCDGSALSRNVDRIGRGLDFEELICKRCGQRHPTGCARE